MIPYVSFWCIMQFTHSVLAGFTRSGGYDIADEIVAFYRWSLLVSLRPFAGNDYNKVVP